MLRQLGIFTTDLSKASPQVAMKLKMVAAFFAVLCFISPFTNAATRITLDGGYEISFHSGKFDIETFNMQLTKFGVLKNGKRYWNADAISLETIPLAGGRTFIVKNLKINGYVSWASKLKVGTIIVRNVTLDKYDHLLAGEIGTLLDHALDNAYVGMFDFWAPIESGTEYETFVHSIELTPITRIHRPLGNSYFN